MRPLKIIIPTALLLTFALILYFGSHVIAEVNSDCQTDSPLPNMPENPNPLQPPPCDCPPAVAFEYDTVNSGVTIAPGGITMVSVKGGCPPYTWADPGNGYTWANGDTTYGIVNILQCAPDTGGG